MQWDIVGGMTPGMPKACQTGWFEPSGYRFNDLTGSLVGIRESKAKPVSPGGVYRNRVKKTPGYR